MWPESGKIREPARGDGREHNPRGTTMVEVEHFSASGPGWTVECGKEPGVMSRTKQTKFTLEETNGLPDS